MFKLTDTPNSVWKRHLRRGAITLSPTKSFARDTRFYVLGSCFAEEIRIALTQQLGP